MFGQMQLLMQPHVPSCCLRVGDLSGWRGQHLAPQHQKLLTWIKLLCPNNQFAWDTGGKFSSANITVNTAGQIIVEGMGYAPIPNSVRQQLVQGLREVKMFDV
jgi:hypothetical protein